MFKHFFLKLDDIFLRIYFEWKVVHGCKQFCPFMLQEISEIAFWGDDEGMTPDAKSCAEIGE